MINFRALLFFIFLIGFFEEVYPFYLNKNDTIIDTYNKNYILNIKEAHQPIIIDGKLDDPDWQSAEKASNFRLVQPVDTGFASQLSEVAMTFDDKAFYIGFTFYDTIPGKRIMESFKRDFVFNNNDNYLSFFDTFLDQTNGFSFGISASGAKWDGMMFGGRNSNLNWDCKWVSKIKHYDDKWVGEMRIPFKSIRYPSGCKTWYGNFSRLDLKAKEKSSWAPMPMQFPTASLAYAGVLKFDQPLLKSRMMFSLIPYVSGSYSKDFETATGNIFKKNIGVDAKIGLSTSMNLDLTYNPDFSQVEVDQQVTNIDRFELFFPEKRQFFLENSDLFADFGFSSTTPFFSRRIGLDAPVLAGARLSGKVGNDWRIGFMNMTTKENDLQLSRNYTVASAQKKVFARSYFGFFLVNKEYLHKPEGQNLFNRVVGFDYNLASKNNFWNGKFFYHRSFQPGNPGKQYSEGAMINYNSKNWIIDFLQQSVGDNFVAETGYIQRTGFNRISPGITYLFIPNRKVVSHGITLKSSNYFNSDFHIIDYENNLYYTFIFQSRSQLRFGMNDYFIELQSDFDPTHKSNVYLPKGSRHDSYHFFVDYDSDKSKLFTWSGEVAKGTFYNGKINYAEGQLGYRFQPYLNFVLNFAYSDILLPTPFERTKFWLVGPKLDITFTDNLFLSSFVQYNEQIENMNINMRLQWRYQPVSDIYLVYTDNYIPGEWNSKNRALVLKLTYWLN